MKPQTQSRILAVLRSLMVLVTVLVLGGHATAALAEEQSVGVTLRYSDRIEAGGKDNEAYSTYDSFFGYVNLETHGMSSDIQGVEATISVPAQYVEEGSLSVTGLDTESKSSYTIDDATLEDGNYVVKIHVSNFDVTNVLQFQFKLQFKPGMTPGKYTLPLSAKVTYNEVTTDTTPLRYVPLYEDYSFTKYLTSNTSESYAQDNQDVPVSLDASSATPQAASGSVVTYMFRVNQPRDIYTREIGELTITDTLPAGARLAAAGNSGWTDNGNGTVSKTYTGASTEAVLAAVAADKLVLDVSGMAMQANASGVDFYTASIVNTASIVATPLEQAEGEEDFEASDTLRSTLTTRAGAKGTFAKGVQPGSLYDNERNRRYEVRWWVLFRNDASVPLSNVKIQDRAIDGGLAVSGLDARLKFTRLASNAGMINLPEGATLENSIEKVVAYYSDGTTREYTVGDGILSVSGNSLSLTFDEGRECIGYDVVMKDDFRLLQNNTIYFFAYTAFRNPEVDHYNESDANANRYWNVARTEATYTASDGTPITQWWSSSAYFTLLQGQELLEINKGTYYNGPLQNSTPGDSFYFRLTLSGALLDGKDYENLRIIDLLPEGISYADAEGSTYEAGCFRHVGTIENYQGTGRTALIFSVDAEKLLSIWDANYQPREAGFTFKVSIDADASYGVVTNDAYVVGDNLGDYTGTKGETDAYDLDGDNNTTDQVAHASSVAYITGGSTIFATKSVTHAGKSDWSRDGFYGALGEDFDYLLHVQNEAGNKTGAVIYDVLPQVGDKNIFQTEERGSELGIELRAAVEAPAGYTVYYTTSTDVYTQTMDAMVAADVWTTEPDDLSAVTAIKVVANEGTVLRSKTSLDVVVPVTLPASLTESERAALTEKFANVEDDEIAYLTGTNSFGYRVNEEMTSSKQSNSVWLGLTDYSVPQAAIQVTKAWVGGEGESATVELLANGTKVDEVTLTAGNGWTTTFTARRLDDSGEAITYTVDEVPVDGYTTAIAGDAESGFTVTNTSKTGSVIVHYVDEGDNTIADDAIDTPGGTATGTAYDTSDEGMRPEKITTENGKVYELVKVADDSAPETGVVAPGVTEVTYVYREVKGNVFVDYKVYGTDETLRDRYTDTDSASIGAAYDTTEDGEKPTEITTADGRTYRLVAGATTTHVGETKLDEPAEQGEVAEEDTLVTYYYELVTGSVVVHYVDDEGNTIADDAVDTPEGTAAGTAYDTSDKGMKPETIEFDGYTYSYVRLDDGSADEAGSVVEGVTDVTYVYTKATGDVVVHYVDENGNTIADDVTDMPKSTPVGTGYATKDNRPEKITTADGRVYALVPTKTQGTESGTVAPGRTEVTYVYREVKGTVVVDYKIVGTDTQIKDRVVDTPASSVGTAYDTTDNMPQTITYNGKTYRLVMSATTGVEQGSVIEGETVVTYYYELVGTSSPSTDSARPSGERVGRALAQTGDEPTPWVAFGAAGALAVTGAVALKKRMQQ